ncbi:MAG TPA: tetratricopeptide repeat protein [Bacteroidota bacterium]|nr:tetratricopeptide repeat protein [Bacteroidota bacterium]
MTKKLNFSESLGFLLQRTCSEPFLAELESDIQCMFDFEKAAADKSRDVQTGILNCIDASHLETIITKCGARLSPRSFAELLVDVGSLCLRFGEYEQAAACCTLAVKTAKDSTRMYDIAGKALVKRSEIQIRQSAWKQALQDLRAARTFYQKPKNNAGIAGVESNTGVLYASQGNLAKAYEHFSKALALFEKVKDNDMISTTLMNLGIIANMKGQSNEAISFFKRALPQFEKAGDMARLPEVHHNLGMALLSKQDYEAAITQFDESLTYSTQLSFEPMIGISLLGKASAYAKYGDNVLSIAYTNNALNIFRKLNDHLSIADAYKIKGIVQREMKNLDIAEMYFQTSIRLNLEHNNKLNLGESLYELGLLYKERNDRLKSAATLRKSIGCFRSVGAEQDMRMAQAELSKLN